jgi:hypothetical protein
LRVVALPGGNTTIFQITSSNPLQHESQFYKSPPDFWQKRLNENKQ